VNHTDYVNLLRPARLSAGGVWADLGAGGGAFTMALRELIGPTAEIYAVDKDPESLDALERAYIHRFGDTGRLQCLSADFAGTLHLPPLAGVLMANSLHFLGDKEAMLRGVRNLLKAKGLLLVVEYNVDAGNPWVPFPLSFQKFAAVAARAGFSSPRLLATHPSSFLREFYSAAADKPE
jgi:ubiquinone/menaquinone biosynthesis C-methylase UbiE